MHDIRQSDRDAMVDEQIIARGICDRRVIDAMRAVPRERFVRPPDRARAYDDRALPIESDQTISQPYVVALMTELLHLAPEHRVLEVGTGSGYQTAVLAQITSHVYSIERIASLSEAASTSLRSIGVADGVTLRTGDGSLGWPEAAPFDRIIVTAAAPALIRTLIDQLVVDGRLVMPLAECDGQRLCTIIRSATGHKTIRSIPVRFVRLIGEQAYSPD